MKRAIVITLVILYSLFSAGVVLSAHFCNGNFDEVSLFSNKHCCSDSDSTGSCCQNRTTFLKIKDSYDSDKSLPYAQRLTLAAEPSTCAHNFGLDSKVVKVGALSMYQHNVERNSPVYILNCALII